MTHPTTDEDAQIRKAWTIGSYATLAREFTGMAAELVDAASIEPGDRVLDVACGTGNATLTAHRRGADVTGVDITPAMLDAARDRAAIVDAEIDWREGDATALPFEDGAFDVTLSCLGHAFAEDPDASGAELVRVTNPGGRVAFTAWTPASAIAAMVGTLAEFLPSDPDAPPPPALWGDPDTVRGRLGDRVDDLRFETGTVQYAALSPAHFWEGMTTDSGSIHLMVEDVEERDLPGLRTAEEEALASFFSDADNAVELEYLLVTGTVAD